MTSARCWRALLCTHPWCPVHLFPSSLVWSTSAGSKHQFHHTKSHLIQCCSQQLMSTAAHSVRPLVLSPRRTCMSTIPVDNTYLSSHSGGPPGQSHTNAVSSIRSGRDLLPSATHPLRASPSFAPSSFSAPHPSDHTSDQPQPPISSFRPL